MTGAAIARASAPVQRRLKRAKTRTATCATHSLQHRSQSSPTNQTHSCWPSRCPQSTTTKSAETTLDKECASTAPTNPPEVSSVITKIHYQITSTADDGYIKINYKQLELPSPSNENFIDINTIDEATLIAWVEAQPEYLTDEEKSVIEMRLQFERDLSQFDDYKFSWMPDDDLRYNFSR